MDTMTVKAMALSKGDEIVAGNGDTATVLDVTNMASGTVVSVETSWGVADLRYDFDYDVEIISR